MPGRRTLIVIICMSLVVLHRLFSIVCFALVFAVGYFASFVCHRAFLYRLFVIGCFESFVWYRLFRIIYVFGSHRLFVIVGFASFVEHCLSVIVFLLSCDWYRWNNPIQYFPFYLLHDTRNSNIFYILYLYFCIPYINS